MSVTCLTLPCLLTEDVEGVYSATEKSVIRNHVSYVCRKQHCADTLVLYLNSPTRNDGTMLLWDANLNGIVRDTQTVRLQQITNTEWKVIYRPHMGVIISLIR